MTTVVKFGRVDGTTMEINMVHSEMLVHQEYHIDGKHYIIMEVVPEKPKATPSLFQGPKLSWKQAFYEFFFPTDRDALLLGREREIVEGPGFVMTDA